MCYFGLSNNFLVQINNIITSLLEINLNCLSRKPKEKALWPMNIEDIVCMSVCFGHTNLYALLCVFLLLMFVVLYNLLMRFSEH